MFYFLGSTSHHIEGTFKWLCGLRKDYCANSDVWKLRAQWEAVKGELLAQLNDGSYVFDLLDRYEFDDTTLSL